MYRGQIKCQIKVTAVVTSTKRPTLNNETHSLKNKQPDGGKITVAVRITTKLNCRLSSVLQHKLLPGNITCWSNTVTLAEDRLIYLTVLFTRNSLTLLILIITFSFYFTMCINYELHWSFITTES
jgi:hypothetical protein